MRRLRVMLSPDALYDRDGDRVMCMLYASELIVWLDPQIPLREVPRTIEEAYKILDASDEDEREDDSGWVAG